MKDFPLIDILYILNKMNPNQIYINFISGHVAGSRS